MNCYCLYLIGSPSASTSVRHRQFAGIISWISIATSYTTGMDSAVVDLLLGKIVSILENEASLIGGVHDALKELKLELRSMKSLLEDADQRTSLTQRERSWVADVRDMCYPVEDIIEEFMYHLHNDERRDGKRAKLLHGAIHRSKDLWIQHRIAKKIQGINKELKSILERNQRYSASQIERMTSNEEIDDDHKQARIQDELLVYAKDDHVVGIEGEKQLLIKWLTDGEAERKVISVVGMGGCGKSTLVAKVYNDPIVKRHFECYAWVTVSQTYVLDDLLKRMINELYQSTEMKGIPIELSSIGLRDLAKMLIDYLRPKRYVIVLDDVWCNLWKDLKNILLDDGRGSRLILTTRNDEIANAHFGVRSHVLHVKPLEYIKAWHLFCSTAFFNNANKACPKEIESIATELVRKCNGLPLAILALGGAMSSKKTESEWREFHASLHHELSNNNELEEVKKRILLFSFKDLSYGLKQCFMYCCIFPEDYPIKRKRLIKLWMAEGFIKEVRGKTPEAVADNYLLELVNQNMLQVAERNPHGRPKKCKMHDMMRELALSISEKEKFCTVYYSQESEKEVSVSARRLSIQTDSINNTKSLKGISQLRSLFMFTSDTVYPSSGTNPLPPGLRFLRALDLEDVPIEELPNELVNLFNLRYLNLRGTKVKELPRSIARLRNLETLDITNGEIEALPAGIVELERLRHLKMYRSRSLSPRKWIFMPCKNPNRNGNDPTARAKLYQLSYNPLRWFREFNIIFGTQVPWSICELKNLQTLRGVEAEPRLLEEIKGMTQLKSISMTKVNREYGEDLCMAIGHMNLLRRIFVMATDEEEYLDMEALSAAPPCLKYLTLRGKMKKVPSWFYSLHNLTRLQLHWSRLSEDPLPSIQSLSNLHDLLLNKAYVGGQLCFSSGFSKLNYLQLVNMPQLDNVTIKEGVMPALKELLIVECKRLKTVPQGIEHLQALELLELSFVSAELVESIRGEQSEDRPRVRHIPKIHHFKYDESTPFGFADENLSLLDLK